MAIYTRRWNDPPAAADEGLRVLITRYRPRGVSRSQQTWDVWMPNLGPSVALHAAVYGKGGRTPIPWSAYRSAYLREMRPQRQAIQELARRLRNGENLTLLCSSHCTDPRRCHRSLLKQLIESAAARLEAP
ncbi:DUF488 domain-containing protein [Fontivita pretiosa]|uniref:DUF488 domain-containing protein n=1 Tax=Fontivita pretiosa TaxID=2989684 RepID=UPI003D1735C7